MDLRSGGDCLTMGGGNNEDAAFFLFFSLAAIYLYILDLSDLYDF